MYGFSHKDEDWGGEWVSLVVLATPCKGESGKLGGRRIGGDYREGLAHLQVTARDDAHSCDESLKCTANVAACGL